MKLYYSKGACSLAVRILINELQIPCEYEAVNLKTKQTASGADFLKINPKGSVPALLLDNNVLLTENAAIQQYLADTYKATQLLPPVGDQKRYTVLEWLNFISTELHKSCGPIFNPNIPEQLKEDGFRPYLKAKINFVEQQLSKQKFIAGDHMTIADCYLFVILSWLPMLKVDISGFPKTVQYIENLQKRESVIQSLQEEGILEKTPN